MSEMLNIMPGVAAEGDDQKVFLPRRPNQSQFAPPQYYYPASRGGVVPSWAVRAAPMQQTASQPPHIYQPAQ
jgi:hypothetical protein